MARRLALSLVLVAAVAVPSMPMAGQSSVAGPVETAAPSGVEAADRIAEEAVEDAEAAPAPRHEFRMPEARVTFRNGIARYQGAHGGRRQIFGYRLQWIRAGGESLCEAKAAHPEWDGADVVYRRGGITERYRVVGEDVEQLFEIASKPKSGDPIVVSGRVTTNLKQMESPSDELVFGRGAPEFSLREAVAIDRDGRRTPVEMAYLARTRELRYTVPAEWIATAAFPIVIDPLLGSPFTMDAGLRLIDSNHVHSAIGGRFLTVGVTGTSWWGRFLNSSDGSPAGASFPVPSATWGSMAYLASANKYLVAYSTASGADSFITVYTIDGATGAVSSPSNVHTITDTATMTYYLWDCAVAATSNGWVVGWIQDAEDDSWMVTVSAQAIRLDASGAASSGAVVLRDKTYNSDTDMHDWAYSPPEAAAVFAGTDRFAMVWNDAGDLNDFDTTYYDIQGAVLNVATMTVLNDFEIDQVQYGWLSDSWAEIDDVHIAGTNTSDEFLYVWNDTNYDGYYNVRAKRYSAVDGTGNGTMFWIKGNGSNTTADYAPGSVVWSGPAGGLNLFFITWNQGGNVYATTVTGGTSTITANDIPVATTASAESTARMAINRADTHILIAMTVGTSPMGQMWELVTVPTPPPPTPPQITTTSLPDGQVGAPYAQTLAYTGGYGTPAWSIVSGALPPGLALDPSTGEIAGTPSSAGTYSFTAQVSDGGTDTQPLSIMVSPAPAPPTITTTSLPDATVWQAYAQAIQYTGGYGTPSWAVTAGSLPPGMALDPATGVLSGTPGATGSYTFTVQVTDNGTDTQTLTLVVNATPPPSAGAKDRKNHAAGDSPCSATGGAAGAAVWLMMAALGVGLAMRRR